jgi:sterol desaturase/sphingolipid hydroxylase (fatty acid hydroxylase superfamily)
MPFWLLVGISLIVFRGPWWAALAGLAAWPAVEYAAHRAMHAVVKVSPRAYKKVHGVHHAYPDDLSHFAIPPVAVFAIAFLLAAGLWALGLPLSALGGLLVALVAYDAAHLAAHGVIPFPFAKAIARRHAKHHKNARVNLGVTTPIMDIAVGTEAP